MNVVIEISEDEYEWVKRANRQTTPLDRFCVKAIANGTPLPKGHGRLIDEEDMLSVIIFSKLFDSAKVREVKEALLNIPTIIEADK